MACRHASCSPPSGMSTNRNETVARARAPEVSVNRDAFKRAFLDKLFYIQGKFPRSPPRTTTTWRWRVRCATRCCTAGSAPRRRTRARASRTVTYLSAEFLIGPHLGNNLMNLGLYDDVRPADPRASASISTRCSRTKPEPGLGNGGLGRLAACFIDSLATLEIPTLGYGIRYEFGIFHQEIVDGWQLEHTDQWLTFRNPWEIAASRNPSRGEARRPHGALPATSSDACACAGCRPSTCSAFRTTPPSWATATTP